MGTEVAQPKDYRDLLVWKKGMSLAKQIYLITQEFPVVEKFGLIAQMRRAAVSIPSNIAEGQARNTSGEFVQFLSQALGPCPNSTPNCSYRSNLVTAHDPMRSQY